MNTHDIILVDQYDQQTGTAEKLAVHKNGLLHRAFSVLIFNKEGELLLQKRAPEKYHSGGLWTNTCCSHPFPGEDIFSAAHRRLKEEMGFDCELSYSHYFIYRAELEKGLIEHELDHVFTGTYDGLILPDRNEVADYRFVSLNSLQQQMKTTPDVFTPWFRIIFNRLKEQIADKF